MIKLKISLHCSCVLNSHKCSTPILSEIVHVTLKSAAVVTSEHLNLSAIFVINHSSLNAKVSLWMKVNPVFRNPEKVSLFFWKEVTLQLMELTNAKIMWTFFRDQSLCPLNGGVSKERFYCIQDGAERNIVASGFLDFSLKSYDVCAVKPSYDYDVKRPLDILRLLSMSDESYTSKVVLEGQFCQRYIYWRRVTRKLPMSQT